MLIKLRYLDKNSEIFSAQVSSPSPLNIYCTASNISEMFKLIIGEFATNIKELIS